ncbi:unnamed protein product [Victoria cruziana]
MARQGLSPEDAKRHQMPMDFVGALRRKEIATDGVVGGRRDASVYNDGKGASGGNGATVIVLAHVEMEGIRDCRRCKPLSRSDVAARGGIPSKKDRINRVVCRKEEKFPVKGNRQWITAQQGAVAVLPMCTGREGLVRVHKQRDYVRSNRA